MQTVNNLADDNSFNKKVSELINKNSNNSERLKSVVFKALKQILVKELAKN
jgi:hypothetical protein